MISCFNDSTIMPGAGRRRGGGGGDGRRRATANVIPSGVWAMHKINKNKQASSVVCYD